MKKVAYIFLLISFFVTCNRTDRLIRIIDNQQKKESKLKAEYSELRYEYLVAEYELSLDSQNVGLKEKVQKKANKILNYKKKVRDYFSKLAQNQFKEMNVILNREPPDFTRYFKTDTITSVVRQRLIFWPLSSEQRMEILLAAAVKKINDSETLMATGPLLKFMKDVEEHNPKYLESAQELEWIIKRIEKEWDIAMYIQSIQQDCFAFFDEVDDTMHNVILNHEMMPYFPVQCAKIDIEKVDDTTDKVNARLPVIFWSMSPEEQKEIIFATAVKKIACSKTIRETIPLLRFMKDVEERNPKYLEVIPEILSIFDGELLSLTWDFNYKPKYKNSEEIKIYTEHDPPNRPYKVVLVMLILQNAPHIQIPEWLQTPIQTSKEPLAVKTQDAIEVFKKEASKKGVDAIIVDSTSAELEELEEIINPSTRAESLNWIPGLPGFRHHTKTALFWLCQGIILTNQ